MADEMLEFKQTISTPDDLQVSSYLAKSTSFFLVGDSADAERMLSSNPGEENGDVLTASDGDGDPV